MIDRDNLTEEQKFREYNIVSEMIYKTLNQYLDTSGHLSEYNRRSFLYSGFLFCLAQMVVQDKIHEKLISESFLAICDMIKNEKTYN